MKRKKLLMFESYKQTFVDADNYRQNNWKKV